MKALSNLLLLSQYSVCVNTHIGVGMQSFTLLNQYDYQSMASQTPWWTRWLQRPDLLVCSTSSSDGSWWQLIPGDEQFGGWLLLSRGATWKCCCSFCLCFENWFQGSAGTPSNHSQRLTLFLVPNCRFFFDFARLPLNSVLLRSSLQCQCEQQCTAQAAVPPASFKDKPVVSEELLGMQLHRLCAHTVYLSALDSKSRNWLIFPYSQTSFCAVLHESTGFGFLFSFSFSYKKDTWSD